MTIELFVVLCQNLLIKAKDLLRKLDNFGEKYDQRGPNESDNLCLEVIKDAENISSLMGQAVRCLVGLVEQFDPWFAEKLDEEGSIFQLMELQGRNRALKSVLQKFEDCIEICNWVGADLRANQEILCSIAEHPEFKALQEKYKGEERVSWFLGDALPEKLKEIKKKTEDDPDFWRDFF